MNSDIVVNEIRFAGQQKKEQMILRINIVAISSQNISGCAGEILHKNMNGELCEKLKPYIFYPSTHTHEYTQKNNNHSPYVRTLLG